jgi:ADP-ribosyl-[dinitrogen reductase] hydrolase
VWGASAVPFAWRRAIDAAGPARTPELQRRALVLVDGGRGIDEDWPLAPMLGGARHEQPPVACELPGDPGVLVGNLRAVAEQLHRVEAVISLCRVEPGLVPPDVEHHELLLADRADPAANPNLDLVLADAGETIATLRAEGRRVLVHCRAGRSRAPTVAAAYLARRDGCSGLDAFARIAAELPHPDPHNRAFQRALADLSAPE